MDERTKGWLGGAILSAALLATTWFAPLDFETSSRKARAMIGIFNTVFQPMIDAAGKPAMLAVFGALLALCLWRTLGLRLPSVPTIELPRRQQVSLAGVPDDFAAPMQRKRDLGRLTASSNVEADAMMTLARAAATAPQSDEFRERMDTEFLALGSSTPGAPISREGMAESLRSLHGPDAQLSDEMYEKATTLAETLQRQSTPHGKKIRPVVLARKARERGRDWSSDRSWFGGLPRLGGAPWPAGPDGVPLPFAAQIDLSEVAAACPESPLPHEGSLAFFLNQGAVVHVEPGNHAFTPPPAGLPLAYDEGSYPLPERPSRLSQELFPLWPIEPIGLPLSDDMLDHTDEERHEEIWEAQYAALAERVVPRQYAFGVYSARQEGIAGADMLWWYGAFHVLDCLRDTLDGVERAVALRHEWIEQARGYRAKLAAAAEPKEDEIAKSRAGEERNRAQISEIRRQGAELEAFIAHVEAFVGGRDPWSVMSEDEVAVLDEVMSEARKSFCDLSFPLSMRLDNIRDICIRRMVTGEPEALAALPDDMLAFINERYRATSQDPHQMFGLAGIKQTNLYDHLCDLLLLQLSYDDMNEWRFGDMGLWHFWISPEDAAARRWEKVELTFECS